MKKSKLTLNLALALTLFGFTSLSTTPLGFAQDSSPAAAPSATAASAPSATPEAKAKSDKKSDKKKDDKKDKAATGKDRVAVIKTTSGDITVKLFGEKAPKTVDNFVGLATGKKEWMDPKSGKKIKGKSLYEGTIFHRVIPGFMIQGGDPRGNGTGGPGYTFEDEFKPTDSFDKPGILAMANAGPGTNGSQFFITVAPTPHLAGRHTIFGEVTAGMDVVNKIVNAPTGMNDLPTEPIKIKKIEIK